ncbi:MAG: alpha/beta hydrolase [Thermodesulfobacteriota bacterium]|nr:alpha/beta hydrolase [Thermodesulfobacteriota bacterium]
MNIKYEKSWAVRTIILVLAIIILLLSKIASGESITNCPIQFESNIDQVKEKMKPLNFLQHPLHTPLEVSYFRYYNFDYKQTKHFWGTFSSGEKKIAAHIFRPVDSKGSVFLLHGFFDHTGIMKNLIRHCLDRQYTVAVYDLPGHGFSSGQSLTINDFSEYVIVLEDFIKMCRHDLPGPFHLIGHSTGGAIAFEYLNSAQDLIFKKVILLAPLIHFTSWKMTKVGYFLARPFVKSLPRKFRKNSSDTAFLKKYRNDPLRTERFPLKWLDAIYKWDRRIKGYKSVSKPVLVIQGTGDKVVDWKYNLEFLDKKLSKLEVKWIQNAKHQLLNENESVKSKVLQMIAEYLEG